MDLTQQEHHQVIAVVVLQQLVQLVVILLVLKLVPAFFVDLENRIDERVFD
jgi:hypothetical protein